MQAAQAAITHRMLPALEAHTRGADAHTAALTDFPLGISTGGERLPWFPLQKRSWRLIPEPQQQGQVTRPPSWITKSRCRSTRLHLHPDVVWLWSMMAPRFAISG